MSIERRGYPRLNIMAQIRVKRGRVSYIMDVVNISRSGLFVSLQGEPRLPWFRPGQELEMDLFTSDDLENISLGGKIVRIVDDPSGATPGFGVQFTALSPEAWQQLDLLIDKAQAAVSPPPLPSSDSDPGSN